MGKSLISLIKEAIVSHSEKNVTIHERTLVTELIEAEKKRNPFSLCDFLPRKYSGKNFVLTRHLIYIYRCIVLFFIALFYAVYDLLHKICTGEWKSKALDKKFIEDRIPDEKRRKKLHTEKWRGIESSTGLNAIIFICTLVFTIITLIWGLHFLLKEVVLPDNDCQVNHYGIVTFDQGCLEEQHFFLLNAATFWANTGIAVSKGDKVYITASGSMYSDVDDMIDAAADNKCLLYPRSDFYKLYREMDQDAEYCIYGRFYNDTTDRDNKPVFGSLLYQICDEVGGPKCYNDSLYPTVVKQINFAKNKNSLFGDKRYHFKAKNSGILYFSFNDILLDDSIIDAIIKNHGKKSVEVYNSLMKKIPKDSVCCSFQDTCFWLKSRVDSLIWFEDNLGEALINIRVERNVWHSHLPLHKKLMIAFYRKMNSLYTKTENGFPIDFLRSGLLLMILIVLLWFGIDTAVSNSLKKSKAAGKKQ